MSRVAIIGSGAVGCYYGARLAEAGHEVHFLMRRDYEAVASGGLHVVSKDGDIHLDR
ncbi:MAG: 2-dehydropantoate 2-reductase, partial [Dehalococcoidia bacterium]